MARIPVPVPYIDHALSAEVQLGDKIGEAFAANEIAGMKHRRVDA